MGRAQFGIIQKTSKPELITSGTVSILTGGQYGYTPNINEPVKKYKRFTLAFKNSSGQNINSISVIAKNVPFSSGAIDDVEVNGRSTTYGTNNSSGTMNYSHEVVDTYDYIFGLGVPIQFQFNLAAALAANGTIDYMFYGFE